MLVKEKLSKCVSDIFPDINHSNITINDSKINEWIESTLLPFLFYQNTIDSKSRIINLFLPESSISKNLVPIYISMGFFRKVLNKTQGNSQYKNKSFSDKYVPVNGSILSITTVDYIGQILSLDNGRTIIPFDNILNLRWDLYKSSLDIRDEILHFIDERNKIFKANKGNIFSFPIKPNNSDYEGAIIFTNVSEFIARIKAIKVSGENILDYIHIQKVIARREIGHYKVQTISNARRTSNKPVSILIAPNNYAYDYNNIINSQEGRLNHIKTIIWDNFDELINNYLKSDQNIVFKELNLIKELYFNKVHDSSLKDIYLISDNYNIHIYELLSRLNLGDCFHTWLFKPVERLRIEGYNKIKPKIFVLTIKDVNYYNLVNEIKEIINSWKELSNKYPVEGEVIKRVSFLYDLLLKIQTFSAPYFLSQDLSIYREKLENLKKSWFISNQDGGVIDRTINFCISLTTSDLNFKANLIIEVLRNLSINSGQVIIVSKNSNQSDFKFINNVIKEKYPLISFEMRYSSDIIKEPSLSTNLPEAVIYLDCRDKLRTAPFLNVYSENQVFIIDNMEFNIFKRSLNRIDPIIKSASDDIGKLILLNLEDTNLVADYEHLDVIMPIENQVINKDLINEIVPVNFEAFCKSVFNKEQSLSSKHTLESDEYIVFMEDNSYAIWFGSKKVFVFNEDDDSLDKSWISVDTLMPGYEIILVKNEGELKDLITRLLQKREDYVPLIDDDKLWRIRIKDFILSNQLVDYHQFAQVLNDNQFEITGITVDNWVNEHVLTPQNFNKLLFTLFKIGIIEDQEIMRIYNSNKKLKNIKVTFIRESVKNIICELKGIPFISANEIVDKHMVDELSSYITIKKVKSLNKL